ncbi:MAG: thioredoxin family protein, partial [bacterium]
MKRLAKLLLFTLLAAGIAFGLAFSDDDESKEIKWYGFEEALQKGKTENKMIVIDFYTDWCSWCKVMDKKTYGNDKVIDFASKKLVLAKVNAESNEKTTFQGKEYT